MLLHSRDFTSWAQILKISQHGQARVHGTLWSGPGLAVKCVCQSNRVRLHRFISRKALWRHSVSGYIVVLCRLLLIESLYQVWVSEANRQVDWQQVGSPCWLLWCPCMFCLLSPLGGARSTASSWGHSCPWGSTPASVSDICRRGCLSSALSDETWWLMPLTGMKCNSHHFAIYAGVSPCHILLEIWGKRFLARFGNPVSFWLPLLFGSWTELEVRQTHRWWGSFWQCWERWGSSWGCASVNLQPVEVTFFF